MVSDEQLGNEHRPAMYPRSGVGWVVWRANLGRCCHHIITNAQPTPKSPKLPAHASCGLNLAASGLWRAGRQAEARHGALCAWLLILAKCSHTPHDARPRTCSWPRCGEVTTRSAVALANVKRGEFRSQAFRVRYTGSWAAACATQKPNRHSNRPST